MDFPAVQKVGAGRVALGIKVLRIEAVPPLAFAIGFRQLPIVWNSGLRAISIRALCDLIPGPGMGGMDADAEGL